MGEFEVLFRGKFEILKSYRIEGGRVLIYRDSNYSPAMVFVPDAELILLEVTEKYYKNEIERLRERVRGLELSHSVEG